MKLWTLTENMPGPGLEHEHGLSLFVEAADTKLLFDFGQTGAFMSNAEKMGIRLEEAEFAILSHGHFDHGGGLVEYLEKYPEMEVYVNQYAFGSHHRADGTYIGLDKSLTGHPRLCLIHQDLELRPGIRLVQCAAAPMDSQGLTRREGTAFLPEDFRHEQYLWIQEEGKSVLVSGCSHRGAALLLEYFRPDVLIGGLHCRHLDPQGPELEALAEALDRSGARIITGHCTGGQQYEVLKKRLGDRIQYISTGSFLEI